MLNVVTRILLSVCALFFGVIALIAVPMTGMQQAICVLLAVVPVLIYPASVWGVLIFSFATVDFTLQTGWLHVSEFDAIVGLAAGVGLLRTITEIPTVLSTRPVRWLLYMLCAVFIVATLRTFAFALPTWDGNAVNNVISPWLALYHGKPYLYILMLLPLLACTAGRSGRRVGWSVVIGSWAAMVFLSVAALWERFAYTGLLNFASDYRITLGISSMHTGSGALDLFIVLAFPLAMTLLFERRLWLQIVGLVSFPLFAYTAFVTFSRGVQLGLAVAALCAMSLYFLASRVRARAQSEREDGGSPTAPTRAGVLVAFVLLVCTCVIAMFPTSGYRGAAAMASCALALYAAFARTPMEFDRRGHSQALQSEFTALLIGLPIALIAVSMSAKIPKLPYVVHAILFCVSAVASAVVWFSGGRTQNYLRMTAQICALALLGSVVAVSVYWGETKAAYAALGSTVATLIFVLCTRPRTLAWPVARHSGVGMSLAFVCVIGIAAATNASFFKQRSESAGGDLSARANHWRTVLEIGAEERATAVAGNGAGQFFLKHAQSQSVRDKPASFWWVRETDGGGALRLQGGKYQRGFGEMIRIVQRLDAVNLEQDFTLVLRVLPGPSAAQMEIGVCEKVLLFNPGCGGAGIEIPAVKADGEAIEITQKLTRAPKLLPAIWRPQQFSFGVASNAAEVTVRSIELRDAQGRNVLKNHDFEFGMDHWFHTTEAWHLPWHTHNAALAAWFDAGLPGLMLWGMFVIAALTSAASALAKAASTGAVVRLCACIGAIVGALAIGLIDSLIDIPRVTLWLLMLLCVSLAMSVRPKRRSQSDDKPAPELLSAHRMRPRKAARSHDLDAEVSTQKSRP